MASGHGGIRLLQRSAGLCWRNLLPFAAGRHHTKDNGRPLHWQAVIRQPDWFRPDFVLV